MECTQAASMETVDIVFRTRSDKEIAMALLDDNSMKNVMVQM